MANELDDLIRISDKTLMAPLVLSKNLEEVYKTVNKIASSKGVSTAIDTASTSTKKLKDETKLLTKQTQDLAVVQKQMVSIVEKDNQAYAKETALLSQLNTATKERVSTSDKQLKSVAAVRAELDKARASYAALRTEEQRNTKEGKELLATTQKLDSELHKLTLDTDKAKGSSMDYTSVLSKLKKGLKEAQGEMSHISDTLGADSEEYKKAAERAGELQDKVQDLKEATKAVSGEPIERLSGSFDLLRSKVLTLDLKGATGAIKGITSATKDLTFKTAAQGAQGFGSAMGGLGKALLTNPIFLLVAVAVAIGFALIKLKDKVKIIGDAFDAIGEVIDWVVGKITQFTDYIGLTTVAFDEHTKSIIENSEKQRKAYEELYDDQIKLASAAGDSTVEAEKKKQEAIAATTNIAIQAFRARQQYGSKLSEDEQKQFDELIKANHDAEIELKAIGLRVENEKEKAAEDAMKKARERRLREQGDALKLSQFLIANQIKTQQEIVANEDASFDKRMDAADDLVDLRKKQALQEYEAAVAGDDLTNSQLLLAHAKFQQELTDIEKQGVEDRKAVVDSNVAVAKANMEKILAEKIAGIEREAQVEQNALDDRIDLIKQNGLAEGKTREEIEKEINKVVQQYADDRVQIEIKAQEQIIALLPEGTAERIAAEQKLHELRLALTDAYVSQVEEKEKGLGEKIIGFIDKWKDAYAAFAIGVSDIFAGFTEKRIQQLDQEKKATLAQRDELLKQYEGDAQRQASIKEQFAKKDAELEARKRKEQRKQAIFDKAVALSIAGIKLAEAIVAMLSVGPVGFALSAVAAAVGAVQLGVIAAKPIPAAEKGIRNHKGLVVAGEKGHELIEMPGNRLAMTDSKPTLYDVPAGTNIYSAGSPETINALASRSLPILKGTGRGPVRSDRQQEMGLLSQINKTIKGKPSVVVQGRVIGYTSYETRISRLDALRNG